MHDKVSKLIDEAVLIEQCCKRDRSAQKLLFDHYYHKMMTVCLRYIKNEEEAREVINNAFLKVFFSIKQFKSNGSLEGWIKRIVVNSSIDHIRSIKTYKGIFVQAKEERIFYDAEDLNEPEDDWFNFALEISKEEIYKMVSELPNATKIVFNMYVIDEFSHKQIAEKLNISTGTSKWHLSASRKYLKDKINKAILARIKTSDHGA